MLLPFFSEGRTFKYFNTALLSLLLQCNIRGTMPRSLGQGEERCDAEGGIHHRSENRDRVCYLPLGCVYD